MRFAKNLRKNKILLLMALPGVIWCILFCYLPMFGIIIAFKDFEYTKGILGSKWVGLQNFKFLFQTQDAFIITRNTLLYNLAFILGGMLLSITLAIIFDLLGKSKLGKFNQSAILFPYFLSWVVISYFGFAVLSADKGIANKLISIFGGESINWYSEPAYWPCILFISYIWKTIGYSNILYYASIRGIDVEYYEAAKIDGAKWYQQIWNITIPLLKPIVILMFLLSVGKIMYSDFGLFYMMPKNSGMLYSVTSTVDTYVYNGMISVGDIGSTAAVGFYQSIIGFILIIFSNGIVRKISNENSLF